MILNPILANTRRNRRFTAEQFCPFFLPKRLARRLDLDPTVHPRGWKRKAVLAPDRAAAKQIVLARPLPFLNTPLPCPARVATIHGRPAKPPSSRPIVHATAGDCHWRRARLLGGAACDAGSAATDGRRRDRRARRLRRSRPGQLRRDRRAGRAARALPAGAALAR